MKDIKVVSKVRFEKSYWRRPQDYSFAKEVLSCPISIGELKRAILTYPVGFVENSSGYQCTALLGVFEGENLQVSQSGAWTNGYTPNEFRGYPFSLVKKNASSEEYVVCIDCASGLVTENNKDLTFFQRNGSFSHEFQEIVDFLTLTKKDASITESALISLVKAKLIQPWNISLEIEGGAHKIEGLSKINEERLNDLDSYGLECLRNSGALYLAYCQIISTQHLKTLFDRALNRTSKQLNVMESGSKIADLDSGTISFDNL